MLKFVFIGETFALYITTQKVWLDIFMIPKSVQNVTT